MLRRYSISRAIVYGSYARREATAHSDIDLILVQRTRKRFLDRYKGLLRDLTKAAKGPSVEPLIYTRQELEQMKDRPFIRAALQEGIVIYEQE